MGSPGTASEGADGQGRGSGELRHEREETPRSSERGETAPKKQKEKRRKVLRKRKSRRRVRGGGAQPVAEARRPGEENGSEEENHGQARGQWSAQRGESRRLSGKEHVQNDLPKSHAANPERGGGKRTPNPKTQSNKTITGRKRGTPYTSRQEDQVT